MNIYVPGTGNRHAKIVLLGEAPSREEETKLQPFVGPSGQFLDRMLAQAKINRSDCWITNVSKYAVPPNAKVGKKIPFHVRAKNVGIDIEQQVSELRIELNQIKPNLIVPLGATALWAMTGKLAIQKFRGSIMQGMGYKLVPTYHPAHILHQEGDVKGYWNKTVLEFDLRRAAKQSYYPELRLPQRILRVARTSSDFVEFLIRNQDKKHPSIDIEADNCIPICVGISFDPREGITIPLWNVNDISNIPDSDLVNMWRLLADFLSQHEVVGQNFGYDRDKIKRLGFKIGGLKSDTMLKAFCINPELPKNLAFNTSIYTEEPYYKDEGMYQGSIDDLFIGCARDACVTKEIDLAMDSDLDELGVRAFYENFILKLHDLYADIEQTGFNVSREAQERLLEKYIRWDEDVRYRLFKLTGRFINTQSPKQISELMYDELNIPRRIGTGEEVITQLLNGAVKNELQRTILELILEHRRVRKTIGTYLYSLSDYDGRMRTSYFICLETGRSSTTQQEPPIRPIVHYKDTDGKKKTQARGMPFQTITKHGDIGNDIREMLIPDEGEIFLSVDSAQAEARVIFLLAEDYEALQLIDTIDYHALTTSWFFGGTEQDYSKKVLGYESPKRFAGKTLRHAGHLGAGKGRAAIEVNTLARKNKINYRITEMEAGNALKIFHSRQPKIKKIFQQSVIDCLQKDRRLRAPVPYGIDAKIGGTRQFFERWNEELFRQAFSYIPQRTVSENTKGAALRIRSKYNWIKILVEAHDGLLVSVPIVRKLEGARILIQEMEVPIDFSSCSLPRGILTIPAEVEEGYDYCNLRKVKWENAKTEA